MDEATRIKYEEVLKKIYDTPEFEFAAAVPHILKLRETKKGNEREFCIEIIKCDGWRKIYDSPFKEVIINNADADSDVQQFQKTQAPEDKYDEFMAARKAMREWNKNNGR